MPHDVIHMSLFMRDKALDISFPFEDQFGRGLRRRLPARQDDPDPVVYLGGRQIAIAGSVTGPVPGNVPVGLRVDRSIIVIRIPGSQLIHRVAQFVRR
jgi:hypothetical protein